MLPRDVGHWAKIVSSAAGIAIGMNSLAARQTRRLDAATWFVVTALLVMGVFRIQDGAGFVLWPVQSSAL